MVAGIDIPDGLGSYTAEPTLANFSGQPSIRSGRLISVVNHLQAATELDQTTSSPSAPTATIDEAASYYVPAAKVSVVSP